MKGFFSIVAFFIAIIAVAAQLLAFRAELQLKKFYKKSELLSNRVTLLSEREELLEASREKKIYEKLKERHWEKYNIEVNLLMQKEMDDIGQKLHWHKN